MVISLSWVMIIHATWRRYVQSLSSKIFSEMMRELEEVRYVPQLKKNLISISVLKVLSLEISGRNGVLKMLRGSKVVMKDV